LIDHFLSVLEAHFTLSTYARRVVCHEGSDTGSRHVGQRHHGLFTYKVVILSNTLVKVRLGHDFVFSFTSHSNNIFCGRDEHDLTVGLLESMVSAHEDQLAGT